MSYKVLEKLVQRVGEYCYATEGVDDFVFYWHGGEPFLAGPKFYEDAKRLEDRYIPKGISVHNALQTNGTLLDQKWIDTLNSLDFRLCVSLDGPEIINDSRRKTFQGKGTYQQVRAGINLLSKNNFPIWILAVITPEALAYGREIYKHFREMGCNWMDFMYPMCNWAQSTVKEQINPDKWGDFYIEVFDAWMEEGDPSVYIRSLFDWCMLLMGGKTLMCTSQSDCSYVLTVDTEGNVYTCDDLMAYCDSHLGDLNESSLIALEKFEKIKKLADLNVLYGTECLECSYFPFCKGGCTLFRVQASNNFLAKHFYCESQRKIISHIRQSLTRELMIAGK